MAQGILAGSFWGLVVGGAGAVLTHMVADPVSVAPTDVAVIAPQAQDSAPAPAVVMSDPVAPSTPNAPQPSGQAPALGSEAAQDATGETPLADTQSAERPAATATAPDLDGPAPAATGTGVEVQVEAPVLPNPQALAPAAPETEELASAATATPDTAPDTEEPPSQEQPEDSAQSEQPESAPEEPKQTPDEAPAAPEDVADPEVVEDDTPQGGTIGNLAEGVTTNRLPSIGEEAAPEAEAPPAATSGRAIKDFAVSVDVDPTKPLMSIVLIDDGSVKVGPEALQSFPYPITFAVDAALPNAGELMAGYRSAGYEVMALANTPQGTQPADLEVAVAAYLAAVPEAVGLFEVSDRVVQTSTNLRTQLIEIAADQGLGLLSYQAGLNPLQRDAAKADVPAGVVFRDLDGDGQDAGVIRRFLDQAAFKAAQEGGVIMVGRVKPETISALLIWGLGQRAGRVSLVPISTLLTSR